MNKVKILIELYCYERSTKRFIGYATDIDYYHVLMEYGKFTVNYMGSTNMTVEYIAKRFGGRYSERFGCVMIRAKFPPTEQDKESIFYESFKPKK